MKKVIANDELFKNWAKNITCLHFAVTKGDKMGRCVEKNKEMFDEEFVYNRLCYVLKEIKRDDLRSHFMDNFLEENPSMSDWLKKHDNEIYYLTNYPYEEAMRLIKQKEQEKVFVYQGTIEKEVEAVCQQATVLFINKQIDLALEKKDKDQFFYWSNQLQKDTE